MRSPPKPGSITIAGATAIRSNFVNGNFELTEAVSNGKPVYQKKGNSSTWLEVVKTSSGTWRWYVKPTSALGPDNSICFGYGTCDTLRDPHECDRWYVFGESEFVLESDATCDVEPLGLDTIDVVVEMSSSGTMKLGDEDDGATDHIVNSEQVDGSGDAVLQNAA